MGPLVSGEHESIHRSRVRTSAAVNALCATISLALGLTTSVAAVPRSVRAAARAAIASDLSWAWRDCRRVARPRRQPSAPPRAGASALPL